jgi:hypothetical protein
MTMMRDISVCLGCGGRTTVYYKHGIRLPCPVCMSTGTMPIDLRLTATDRALAAAQVQDDIIRRSQYGA